MGSKAALVEQVKGIQRASAEAKQAWWNHCDLHLGGVHDPNRHDEAALSAFIQLHHAGGTARPAAPFGGGKGAGAYVVWAAPPSKGQFVGGGGGGAGGAGLAGGIKEGQRRCQSWREAWQKYCAVHGDGFNDPARHEDPVLVGFLDFAGRLASAELDSKAEQQGVDFESKGLKRAAPASEWQPPARRGAYLGPDGGEKAGLVKQVKDLQRSSPEAKQAWWTYCDDSLGGVRDPGSHDASILRYFLSSQGVN